MIKHKKVDKLAAEREDLGAANSEIVETILTTLIRSEAPNAEQARDIILRKTKGWLLIGFKSRVTSAWKSYRVLS
jgi:hypothetical protein